MEYVTSWERKGIEKGLQQGRREGRQEAMREMLLEILATKFGPPAESVAMRVRELESTCGTLPIVRLRRVRYRISAWIPA